MVETRMPEDLPVAEESNLETIRGEVVSVVFHNDENGYSVLRLALDEPSRGSVETVVGNLPAVTAGERLQAAGEWFDDPHYGRQFRARRMHAEAPVSKEGIERFLASGLIEGIGKEYARRIVERFGTEVFDVIDHASQRLEEIDGIGAKRRRQIKESWKQQRSVRDIMVFLHGHGISAARASRIFKTYGEDAIGIVQSHPYRLAEDIPGIGFKTADEIAGRTGQAQDAPARLRAGIDHILKQAAANEGHGALPREELVGQAVEMLAVEEGRIAPILDEMIEGGDLIGETSESKERLYLPELHAAEVSVAERVAWLVKRPAGYPEIDAERALSWFEERAGLELGGEQRDAIRESLSRRLLVITGGPGVGKTTILHGILKILVRKRVKPVLCAPTGRAAKRLSESTGTQALTLHRLLEFQPGGGFARGRKRPLDGDLFIVDEVSMIDVVLMRSFLEAIPENGHVLLVGDVDQLPSVGPGRVLADLIDSGVVPVARLEEIFRQAASSRIITAAHSVNRGELPDLSSPKRDDDFFFLESGEAEKTLPTLIDVVSRRLPAHYGFDPAFDIQVLSPMNRNLLGTGNLNERLQAALNPAEGWKFEIERFGVTFRAGDKVIQTRNNYDKEVFNGDIGVIREITTDPARVQVQFDGGREVDYEPGELDEVQLAYAITIHKSQGSEFPVVVIPVSTQHYMMLRRNLLYTGITRGKRLVVLVGDRKALAMAVKKDEGLRRWSGLRERLQGAVA